jgi:ring-1,2-phenylacetyl-CoA epoxidase subunit PaaD
VRFWNFEVRENIEGVMDTIVDALGPPPPTPPRKGEESHPRPTQPSERDQELARAHHVAGAVLDPEIPVLTLEDLGVLRGVERRDGRVVVKLTPTYTGCPATLAIQLAVEAALAEAGMPDARVETVLSPPWSTDQISEGGRRKLKEFGIAPPNRAAGPRALFGEETVACPKCGSAETAKVSEFGSTACKAHWRCNSCAEPFDYYKCI